MAPIHHHFELGGLARDHGHHPVLDPRRAVHRAGPRPVLRRLRAASGCSIDGSGPARRPGRRTRRWSSGFGVTGQAMVAALRGPRRRGHRRRRPSLDRPRGGSRIGIGVELVEAPSDAGPGRPWSPALDAVLPSPGVPDRHPVFAAGRPRPASPCSASSTWPRAWDDRPLVAITGTDGKTTVTTMVTEMLDASGDPALAVGNTEVPLVEAIDRSRPRRVRGRGVVVPARPHPALRAGRGHVAELRRPTTSTCTTRSSAYEDGQGPHLGRPRARTAASPSPTPTTRS